MSPFAGSSDRVPALTWGVSSSTNAAQAASRASPSALMPAEAPLICSPNRAQAYGARAGEVAGSVDEDLAGQSDDTIGDRRAVEVDDDEGIGSGQLLKGHGGQSAIRTRTAPAGPARSDDSRGP